MDGDDVVVIVMKNTKSNDGMERMMDEVWDVRRDFEDYQSRNIDNKDDTDQGNSESNDQGGKGLVILSEKCRILMLKQ